jgi:hypothetical protein
MALSKMKVEVLPDGSLKIVSDAIAGPLHTSAEGMIKEMVRLMGGKADRRAREDVHKHIHTHDGEEHTHEQ